MKPSTADAWVILHIAGTNLKQARAEYAKRFGRAFDDPSILTAVHDTLRDGDRSSDDVSIPVEVAVALALWPRGKGKGRKHGRPKKEVLAKRWYNLALRIANKYWAEHVGDLGSKPAKHAGAELALKTVRFGAGRQPPTLKTLKRDMRLGKGQADLASNDKSEVR